MKNKWNKIGLNWPNRPLNIAHRGARSLAPENTIAAAHKAVLNGADMWELDVQLTADFVPIVIHDDTLERTSNVSKVSEFSHKKPWPAHMFTLSEIRRLDFGTWFIDDDPFGQIAAGNVGEADFPEYAGARAPTLREALRFAASQGLMVNVEIKDLSGLPGDLKAVENTLEVVDESDSWDQVIVSSFNPDYVKAVKHFNPEASAAVLVEERPENALKLLEETGAAAYHPAAWVIELAEIAGLREAGYLVNVWTVNEEDLMRRLLDAGATGIITDFPQMLHPLLNP